MADEASTNVDVSRYTPTAWKKKEEETFDIELPSGQIILAKKLGMKEIIKTGMVAQLDTFTAQLLPDGTSSPEKDANRVILDAIKDEKKFEQLEQTINKVVLVCVLQPKVLPIPPEGYDRNPEAVYIDDISLDDKMYIFSIVFEGNGDMSQFREGQGGDMAAVEAKPEPANSAESDGGVPAGIS